MPVMIPKQTLAQITSNTLMCIGATNITFNEPDNTLKMRVRVFNNQRTYLSVHLNGLDLYDVKLEKIRGGKVTTLYTAYALYCDQINETVFRMCSPNGATAGWMEEVGIRKAA